MKHRLTLICYLFASLIIGVFGVIYTFKGTFMPHHAEALQMTWYEVPMQFRVIIISLMRAVGMAGVCLSLITLTILLTAFRQGQAWAQWVLPVSYITSSFGMIYAMLHIIQKTNAHPPWEFSLIVVALATVGWILSILPNRSRKTKDITKIKYS